MWHAKQIHCTYFSRAPDLTIEKDEWLCFFDIRRRTPRGRPCLSCAAPIKSGVGQFLAYHMTRSGSKSSKNDVKRRDEDQDQDQDSLLVKRRNDNHSPGPVIRELVPSSHQRSELSNTKLCIFSG